MTTIKRFGQNQKFRVIVNRVSFYATAKQIRYGVGDFVQCNAAVQKALDSLEFMRAGIQKPIGLAGTWEGMEVQLDIVAKN